MTSTQLDTRVEAVPVTQDQFDTLCREVHEVREILSSLQANIEPALEMISKGGIMSLLMPKRKG